MTDAKIIALFDALGVADKIMGFLTRSQLKKNWDIDCSFHGIETSEDESDQEKDVFAMVIRVEVAKT